jgi:hypothetical protein
VRALELGYKTTPSRDGGLVSYYTKLSEYHRKKHKKILMFLLFLFSETARTGTACAIRFASRNPRSRYQRT